MPSRTGKAACRGRRARERSFDAGPQRRAVQCRAAAVGTAVWTGVSLAEVLRAAGVRGAGRHVLFVGLDAMAADTHGFGGSIPLEKATSPEVLLAYEMNGLPLPPVHGFPLRVVVPGYIGARSVKWLRSVAVAAAPSENYFQAHAYKLFPPSVRAHTADWNAGGTLTGPPVSAVICAPRQGQRLRAGHLSTTGYAFAGGRPVARVEATAGGAVHWEAARLAGH